MGVFQMLVRANGHCSGSRVTGVVAGAAAPVAVLEDAALAVPLPRMPAATAIVAPVRTTTARVVLVRMPRSLGRSTGPPVCRGERSDDGQRLRPGAGHACDTSVRDRSGSRRSRPSLASVRDQG